MQLGALARTSAHVQSETTNSVDAIMATVSRNVCYIMPDVSKADLPIAVMERREQVSAYYREERKFLEVVDACDLVELSSDWYVFHEGFSATLEVETGRLFRHNYVVLFPVAEDGIIGEILWPRQSLADLYSGREFEGASDRRTPGDTMTLRHSHRRTHDAYLERLRDNDVSGAAKLWASDARVAVRCDGPRGPRVLEGTGVAGATERISVLLASVEEPQVRVLSRVIGEWYVFADWVMRGRSKLSAQGLGTMVELRIASIHPMTSESLIAGELGYGLDAEIVPA